MMDMPFTIFNEWNTAVIKAIDCLNTKQFPSALVEALSKLVRIESVMVSLEYRDKAPVWLFDQGIPLEKRDLVINHYFSGGYLLDPFCWAVKGGLKEGFYHLSDIAPDDFFNSEYYKIYYVKAGSVEDCYFSIDVNDEAKISICLYHGQSSYRFSKHELSALRAAEPLIRGLALKHWHDSDMKEASEDDSQQSLTRPLETAFMNFGRSVLTDRELENTHLLLRGHSSKSAARELDISPDTVREHRKNLYRKLNVNSQSELFSLFIDAISHYGEGSSEDPLENFHRSQADTM